MVKAGIYRETTDPRPWATGYAEEKESERGVNATSALENCETSAIGRALANAGYATKGKRPSREEMTKVANGARAPQFGEFMASLTAATDEAALNAAASLIQRAAYLTPSQKEALRKVFTTRRDEMAAPATVEPPATGYL